MNKNAVRFLFRVRALGRDAGRPFIELDRDLVHLGEQQVGGGTLRRWQQDPPRCCPHAKHMSLPVRGCPRNPGQRWQCASDRGRQRARRLLAGRPPLGRPSLALRSLAAFPFAASPRRPAASLASALSAIPCFASSAVRRTWYSEIAAFNPGIVDSGIEHLTLTFKGCGRGNGATERGLLHLKVQPGWSSARNAAPRAARERSLAFPARPGPAARGATLAT